MGTSVWDITNHLNVDDCGARKRRLGQKVLRRRGLASLAAFHVPVTSEPDATRGTAWEEFARSPSWSTRMTRLGRTSEEQLRTLQLAFCHGTECCARVARPPLGCDTRIRPVGDRHHVRRLVALVILATLDAAERAEVVRGGMGDREHAAECRRPPPGLRVGTKDGVRSTGGARRSSALVAASARPSATGDPRQRERPSWASILVRGCRGSTRKALAPESARPRSAETGPHTVDHRHDSRGWLFPAIRPFAHIGLASLRHVERPRGGERNG